MLSRHAVARVHVIAGWHAAWSPACRRETMAPQRWIIKRFHYGVGRLYRPTQLNSRNC